MCCFVAVLGLFGPRLAVLFAWLFTDRVQIAFQGGWVAPLVGILLLPWTTLAFIVAYAPIVGVSTFGWVIVIVGLLLDLGSYASGGRARSNSN